MGFRFRKSFRLGKGVRLNVSRRSGSVSIGNKWFGTTVGSKGVSRRVSLPGFGTSCSTASKSGCLVPMLIVAARSLIGLAK